MQLWDFSKGLKNEFEPAVRGKRAISVRATEVLLYVGSISVVITTKNVD